MVFRGSNATNLRSRLWPVGGVCALLAILVFAVFGRTLSNEFVNYDDDEYVYKNPTVLQGVSWAGTRWALTHVHSNNWHPLTTLSHMLDCQFYGAHPRGHHLTNVLLHTLAAILLFLGLRELTGAFWRAGLVAAAFAVHPLRVESVAWVAERKDVLSGVFFMLILWSYARSARRPPSFWRYRWVLGWYTLGLLSKPILVTVPFVLLLLDVWPLARWRTFRQLPNLLWEKWPFFALTALSCVATIIAQKQAIMPLVALPLTARITNALVAYVVYLGKLIWPTNLAVLYSSPQEGWPMWQVAASLLLLVVLSIVVYVVRRRQPALLLGWLWYLGMLVPVIGILQVGLQAYADRYTYLPQIGLAIMVIWPLADWAGEKRRRHLALGATTGIILCLLAVNAYRQAGFWRDNLSLWTHTLSLTRDNAVAHLNLGDALIKLGKSKEAIVQLNESLRLDPTNVKVLNNLGNAWLAEGHAVEACARYEEALRVNPRFTEARYNLANILLRQGKAEEALVLYRQTLQINPDYAEAHNNMGSALLLVNRVDEAIAHYREAIRVDPAFVEVLFNLGTALYRQGRSNEAIPEYEKALRLKPSYADAHHNLAFALVDVGRTEEAVAHFETASRLQPENFNYKINLAWTLATAKQTSFRDGRRALELATEVNQATGGNQPVSLRTLAAAQAQAGNFTAAVETVREALRLATAQSNTELIDALPRELQNYEVGQPFPKTLP